MRRSIRVVASIIILTGGIIAAPGWSSPQVEDNSLPRFEVATIKPSNPVESVAGLWTYPGGRVAVGHFNFNMLMMYALDVQSNSISGVPGWLRSDWFDIQAKPPETSTAARSNPPNPNWPPSPEQRQMLLALLIDRFQLKYHSEIKEEPVLFLDRGKSELKLNSPKNAKATPWVGGADEEAISAGNGLSCENCSMTLLADTLSRIFSVPVVDRTGISGSYDFNFRTFGHDHDFGDPADEYHSIILAAVNGIGLAIKSGKAPVRVYVIDHVALPTPN